MDLIETIFKWIIVVSWTLVDVCRKKIILVFFSMTGNALRRLIKLDKLFFEYDYTDDFDVRRFRCYRQIQSNFSMYEHHAKMNYWIARYELNELFHLFQRPTPIERRNWKLVALARYTKNFAGRRQIFPAITLDDSSAIYNDPFWPEHVSVVYNCEISRITEHHYFPLFGNWSTNRQSIVVWQISLLDGFQKIVYKFDELLSEFYGSPELDALPEPRAVFRSGDVLFIVYYRLATRLHVYDTRYKRSFEIRIGTKGCLASISLLRRLRGARGQLEGWRIRIVEGLDESIGPFFVPGVLFRARLVNQVFDLLDKGKTMKWVEGEEVVFGGESPPPRFNLIRTTGGLIGVQNGDNGPSMLYDEASNSYAYSADLVELRQRYENVAVYKNLWSWSSFDARISGNLESLRPIVITERECVKFYDDSGHVVRKEFMPSTLKYLAAKKLFRSYSWIRNEMNARQFRMATGVGGMDAHF